MYNIVIGCYGQETNTFNPMLTGLEDFGGPEHILQKMDFSDLRSYNRAYFEVLKQRSDVKIIPSVAAWAEPWGPCQRSAHEHIKGEILRCCREAGKVDGVLLSLHGAMVLEDDDDAEGDLLEALRRQLGEEVPIHAVLDLHANITEKMLRNASVLINYHTYPHIDGSDRARESAQILLDTLDGKIKPVMKARKLPLLPEFIPTAWPPVKDFQERCAAFEKQSDVISATIAYGFFCADVVESGACVIVITDQNPQKAQLFADQLGCEMWAERQALLRNFADLDASIDDVLAHPDRSPCVFADCWDNPGGGAPGDGTHILRRLLERKVEGAVIAYLRSPETVAQAEKAGVGASIEVSLGGKFFPELCGAPIKATAWVKSISNGICDAPGSPERGFRRIGKLAALLIDGLTVIVSSGFAQTWTPEGIIACGIDPKNCSIIVVKSSVHFRHAFEPLAAKIYDIEVPGKSEQKIANLTFRKCRRPIFPLDEFPDDHPGWLSSK